jgi:hypothetical protein
MFSKFTHSVTDDRASIYFLKGGYYSIACIYHIFFIHSLRLDSIILAVMKSAEVNAGVQMSLQRIDFMSFGYIPSS